MISRKVAEPHVTKECDPGIKTNRSMSEGPQISVIWAAEQSQRRDQNYSWKSTASYLVTGKTEDSHGEGKCGLLDLIQKLTQYRLKV